MFIKSNDNEMNLHDMITKNESLKWYLMTVILLKIYHGPIHFINISL